MNAMALEPLVTAMVCGTLIDSVAHELSTTGVELVSKHAPPVGASISLVFFMDGELVCAHGAVRSTTPQTNGHHLIGVSFSVIEDDGPKLIAAHCGASIS